MRKGLQNMLIELGITPNLTGFDYICDMVEAISEDKERTFQITQLYKKVGEKHGKNWSMVERAIRHAISKAKTDSDAWGKYIVTTDKTNSTVLYILAMRLREEDFGSE